jgi:hypothetical protein
MYIFKTGRGLVFDAIGWDREITEATLDTLSEYGLVRLVNSRSAFRCDVTNRGLDYWRQMKERSEDSTAHIEESVLRFLRSDPFRRGYPRAYAKWAEAERLLWQREPENAATQVGHLIRESMQAFVTELAERHRLHDVLQIDLQLTVARLQKILEEMSLSESKAVQQFQDALVTYWGAVADLSQRQEHGAQKEGEDLGWEDSRRIVFNAAFIMFELDRGIRGIQ